jgi:hypothetical protein
LLHLGMRWSRSRKLLTFPLVIGDSECEAGLGTLPSTVTDSIQYAYLTFLCLLTAFVLSCKVVPVL